MSKLKKIIKMCIRAVDTISSIGYYLLYPLVKTIVIIFFILVRK